MDKYTMNKLSFFSAILMLVVLASVSSDKFFWSETQDWTTCSVQCGVGEEQQVYECLRRTNYGTEEIAAPSKCSQIVLKTNKRNCSMGNCPTKSQASFIWVVGNWTQCQTSCGNGGLKSREVACYLKTFSGPVLSSQLSNCDPKIEPKRFVSCAKYDCPPKFLSSKWGKCPKTVNCGKSIRRRIVRCASLLKDGKHKVIPDYVCYRARLRQLASWVVCTPDNDDSCGEIKNFNKYMNSKPKINIEVSEVYQMRSNRRMRLIVGQKAFIFIYSKISIACPVDEFPPSLLRWSHNSETHRYEGESTKRIHVNRKGFLIIKIFQLIDRGLWKCHAGLSSANITLEYELPSNGYQNWLKRHSNHNYGMFNEESLGNFVMPESLVWMKSDWSGCSISCGGDDEEQGFQVRKVTCEKIEAKYYKIIDDKYCSNVRPISRRRCKSANSCPVWRIEKEFNEKCTDQCINVGLAKMNSNIYCEYETRTVDSAFCDQSKKPNVTCPNNKCKLSYNYGPWSPCSLSCSNITDSSIKSRTMHCIWDHDRTPAYHLCQHHNITPGALTTLCRVPKCILGCRDLSTACSSQSKYRCRSSLFSHICCHFCRQQISY